MLKNPAPAAQALGASPRHLISTATAAGRLSTVSSISSSRTFATVQEGTPKRVHGGLKDSDRIFQNLYGHHGADLKSAMKYGDWYRTKDIILKGHEWVRTLYDSLVFWRLY